MENLDEHGRKVDEAVMAGSAKQKGNSECDILGYVKLV